MLHDSALYKFTIDIHIDIDCDVIQEVVKRLLGVTLRVQCRSKSSTAVSPSRPSSPPGDAVLSQLLIRRRFANIGADSIGDGDTLPLTFTNGWAREGGGAVSGRTANRKLTKLYWPSRKRSPKRLIVLVEPKSRGARQKILAPLLADKCLRKKREKNVNENFKRIKSSKILQVYTYTQVYVTAANAECRLRPPGFRHCPVFCFQFFGFFAKKTPKSLRG